MLKKTLLTVLIGLAIAIIIFIFFLTSTRKADMLFVNGKIYTLDSKNSITEAVAVQGDRILETGTTARLADKYKTDKVIDLQGGTMFPGFIDSHGHILGEGGRLATINLVGTTSIEEISDLVAKKVAQSEQGQWIIGRGWDQNDWKIKKFPDKTVLDKVAPNNPVSLRRVDGHAIWVNQKAIDLAGITSATPDTSGGKILRDAKGNPSGVFIDNAIDQLTKAIPVLTDDEIEERLKLALNEAVQLGLTEVHDMGVDTQTLNIYKKLIDRKECPIRVYALIEGPGKTWGEYLTKGKEIGYGNGMLTIRGIKLYIDGALGSRGAAMIDEYNDDPGNRGLTMMSESEMEAVCKQALDKGFQVCVHAIGDRGNNIVLNVYEKVLSTLPKDSPSPCWRIEHSQILKESDIPRFKQLGIIPSMQPTHATSDMYWAEERVGSERIKGAYAWKSLLNTGVIIPGGSDFPVESVNPLFGIYAASTRMDQDGMPQGGWYPEQVMTREEAVKAFTSWGTYASFEENSKGTIEEGKLADFTVLTKDIMQVPPPEIFKTEVTMTIVGGKIVYQKEK